MSNDHKVLIVGGGLAGLGAAHALRKRGLNPTVLEASHRAGGRIMTEDVSGFRIDAGANIFLEAYGTVMEVADELGVSMVPTPAPIVGGTYFGGKLHGFYGQHSLKNRFKTAKTFLVIPTALAQGCPAGPQVRQDAEVSREVFQLQRPFTHAGHRYGGERRRVHRVQPGNGVP